MEEHDVLPAGRFGDWATAFDDAVVGNKSSDVPCDGCTACCTSHQFIHIAPDEKRTLAHVPQELLFPAPGLPRGHVLLGYDDRGHCPMFVDGHCSIYEVRPRTCRAYDCRVFAAADVEPDKPGIAARARRWTFDHLGSTDRIQHDAVQAAARYLRAHRAELPAGAVPTNPTQLAVLAVRVRHLFLTRGASDDDLRPVEPELARVRSLLEQLRG